VSAQKWELLSLRDGAGAQSHRLSLYIGAFTVYPTLPWRAFTLWQSESQRQLQFTEHGMSTHTEGMKDIH
jgi:hypothetical protein